MKKLSKLFRLLTGVITAALFTILLSAGGIIYLNNPPHSSSTGKNAVFIIHKGENLSQISERLKREGFIRFPFFIRAVSRFKKIETEYKEGYYKIDPDFTSIDIIKLLTSGRQEQVKITFPEGLTIKKIALHLESKKITNAQDFINAAHSKKILKKYNIPGNTVEGYLYPDTYFFPKEFPAETVVDIMVEQFFKVLNKIEPEYIKLTPEELHKKIILASIVEREYRIKSEAPLIASVFFNRLGRNIGLESCATLEYIITEIEGKKHPTYITFEDKKLDSPFNTYKWAGLPPAPIANPGKVAIDAAFHPAKTDYWYFVVEDVKTGRHYFSKSLEEHKKAKYIYLKKIHAGS